jgi:hypothetical protein
MPLKKCFIILGTREAAERQAFNHSSRSFFLSASRLNDAHGYIIFLSACFTLSFFAVKNQMVDEKY